MKCTLCHQDECVLCMACANICPEKAIVLGKDEYGYEKIDIDQDKCINCGLCKKVCDARKNLHTNIPQQTYAAQANSKNALLQSASGGAFQMLAETVLSKGGVCYGCSFSKTNNEFAAAHIRVDSLENLSQILNTKYIPSAIGNSFNEALEDLKLGKLVLFSGTPCQIQGLKTFLGKDYLGLITVDIICHGIASTSLFNDYISQIEKQNKIMILDYVFRDKTVSWGTNFMYKYYKIYDPKKREIIKHCPWEESSYTSYYLQGITLRENCYSCAFATINRVSDFTLGDFWGIESEYPELIIKSTPKISLKLGVSCIMVNTEKAKGFVSNLADKMSLYSISLDSIVSHNANLLMPTKRKDGREELLNMYKHYGYAPIENKYRKETQNKRVIYILKNLFKSYLPDRVRVCIYHSRFLQKIVFH